MPADLDSVARHVALTLASFTSNDGGAEVGARLLADTTGLERVTIARAIRRLETAGVLTVERRSGARSSYRFPVATPVEVVHNRVTQSPTRLSTSGSPEDVKWITPSPTLDFMLKTKTHAGAEVGARQRGDTTCHTGVNHGTCLVCDGSGWMPVGPEPPLSESDRRPLERCQHNPPTEATA